MIRLSDVHFTRERRHILKDVNLHIRQGENWVILGRNGCGKTTMLELMNAYQFPSSGTVHVLGHQYGQVEVREIRKSIGYISQSLVEKLALRDPVWEIVAGGQFGNLRFYEDITDEVKQKAVDWLERVQLKHTADRPMGVLSQGERKKVLLARALLAEPSILIMDEPCSGLDLYERERLLETISALHTSNVTIVYVTHHIEEIMPLFTHVAVVEEGQIIAAGPKKEVLTAQNIERAYQVPVSLEWTNDRPWIKVL